VGASYVRIEWSLGLTDILLTLTVAFVVTFEDFGPKSQMRNPEVMVPFFSPQRTI
jgi:hypothetical protein